MSQSDSVSSNPLATRADACRLLLELTDPLLSCFSPGRAHVKLGVGAASFDRKAAWLEAFARPLWGLAPLHAGSEAFGGWQLFRDGIKNGTDPDSPEFWGTTADYNQRSVEMAALGFALALAPDQLWAQLDVATRDNLARWLGRIQSVTMVDNNWHFLPLIAGLGLERTGVVPDEASKARHLDRIEHFYRGDGWYGDGEGGYVDHYNGFAFHYYGLIYARHKALLEPDRAARYVERAFAFAQGFQHWFGADGAALVQGRSLTYRFACAAFWGALAYADVEALPWAQIRGLWGRHLRWWLRQPIFDATGILSVGYRWPNQLMGEHYNSPGSPYWAFKAFLPLALPATHPFWIATEAEMPTGISRVTIRGASMVIRREAGDAIALMAGSSPRLVRNGADKYAKFAYSTRFGLCVEADRWIGNDFCGDNILAFSSDGRHFSAREKNISVRVEEDLVETTWSPMPEVQITTLQSFVAGWEVRIHQIVAREGLYVIESGHGVPARHDVRREKAEAFGGAAQDDHGIALAVSSGHHSAICDLRSTRQGRALNAAPNTNLVFPHAVVPTLTCRIGAGKFVLVTAVRAFYDPRGTIALGNPPAPSDLSAMLASAGWSAPLVSLIVSGVAPGPLREEAYPVME